MNNIKNKNVSYFAKTNFRGGGHLFGIYQRDRLLHTYILGKTGVRKTNLLTTLILQDILQGRALCVFDVHGDLINTILKYIPPHRKDDLIYLGLADFLIDYLFLNFHEYKIFPILMLPTIKIKREHQAKHLDKCKRYSLFKKGTKNSIFTCYF